MDVCRNKYIFALLYVQMYHLICTYIYMCINVYIWRIQTTTYAPGLDFLLEIMSGGLGEPGFKVTLRGTRELDASGEVWGTPYSRRNLSYH